MNFFGKLKKKFQKKKSKTSSGLVGSPMTRHPQSQSSRTGSGSGIGSGSGSLTCSMPLSGSLGTDADESNFVPRRMRESNDDGGNRRKKKSGGGGGNKYVGRKNKEDQPHGIGIMVYFNDEKYVGAFKNGKRHGKGKLFYPQKISRHSFGGGGALKVRLDKKRELKKDDDEEDVGRELKYDGGWANDLKEGFGTYFFPDNGGYFVGEWKANKKNGKGKTYYKVGKIKYDGGWEGNFISGFGKYYRRDGTLRYEGKFIKGKRNGYGTNYYSNKDVYRGSWKGDKRDGKGVHTYSCGDIFDGKWKGDVKNGFGMITMKNGTVKKGCWLNGKFAAITEDENVLPKGKETPKATKVVTDDSLCSICLEEKKSVLFIPCKHCCTCETCSTLVSDCPMCRAPIADKIKIYL